jgi:hypothetical protein
MLAITLDNVLFLLLIGVAALFQLLSKAIKTAGKTDSSKTSSASKPPTPRASERTPRQSDADRIRKFLEALGQPPSSTPPPPVLPRSDIPPRPLAPVQPPPVIIPHAFGLPRERRQKRDVTKEHSDPSEQQRTLLQTVPPSPSAPPSSAFEVHKALPIEVQDPPIIKTPIEAYATPIGAVAKRADLQPDMTILLRSQSGLRQAIILREVLGPPRGLQLEVL